jgi:prevent-host-death family protein
VVGGGDLLSRLELVRGEGTGLEHAVAQRDLAGVAGVVVAIGGLGATMSHMKVGVRDLRNRTTEVIAAVESGERVTLTVRGNPVADIVPHGQRTRWLSGEALRRELTDRAADPEMADDLAALAGQTLDEL